MKHFRQFILAGTVLVMPLLFAAPVFAEDKPAAAPAAQKLEGVAGSIQQGLTGAGTAYSGSSQDIQKIIGGLINASLSFLGALLLVYLIMAGFVWMTAGGDETKVKKARDMIKNAVIGIVIIGAAFAIANSVLIALSHATNATAIQ